MYRDIFPIGEKTVHFLSFLLCPLLLSHHPSIQRPTLFSLSTPSQQHRMDFFAPSPPFPPPLQHEAQISSFGRATYFMGLFQHGVEDRRRRGGWKLSQEAGQPCRQAGGKGKQPASNTEEGEEGDETCEA